MKKELYQLEQTISQLLNNVIIRIEQIVAFYNDNRLTEANNKMVYLIEDISTLMEGINILLSYNNIPEVNIDEINEIMSSIVEQFENEDFGFISDILNFELKPLLEHWSEASWGKN